MDVKNISAANTQFGLDLFKVVSQDKKNENVFISPFSISVALAMTQLGARENTAAEMASTLKWNVSDESQIHKEFQQYVSLLQKASDQYQLSTANRIYIEKTLKVLEDFVTKAKEHYLAEPVAADFATNFDAERVKINEWVTGQTQGKITDLLPPGTLDSLTRMVLVNAIYFKGLWETQFNSDNTRPGTFKIAPSSSKQVPMMFASKKYAYRRFEDLKCTAVELPYKGNELSMVVILPEEDFGLEKLVTGLSSGQLNSLLKSDAWPTLEIELTLPKFKVTCSLSLKLMLQSLGMRDAFSQTANFKGITEAEELCISAVVHKAFVQVDEQGTEAAAATGMVIGVLCMPPPKPKVTVDHPFLFVIKDKRAENSVLFIGAVTDPSAE